MRIPVEGPKIDNMDYVFVLEDDHLYRHQIQKALNDVNSLLGVKFFNDLEEFYNWLKEVMAQGTRSWASEEDDKDQSRVRLIISRCEFIGHDKLHLLEKVKNLFIRRGMCTEEEPVNFVLTAFDDPGFHIEQYQSPIIANVIFKPFDELILREHLSFALVGRTIPSEFGLSAQKADTTIEMLIGVEMESLSDIGFTVRSKKAFEPGFISKYYGQAFSGERASFVYGRLARCLPHPKYPSEFELDFHFFASEGTQISAIRKRVRNLKDKIVSHERSPPAGPTIDNPTFVIIEPRDTEFESIAGTVRRKVKNVNIVRYGTMKMFEDELNGPSKAKSGLLNSRVSGLQTSREMMVTKCEPDNVTFWNEPLMGAGLTKYFHPSDLKLLGLFLMGNQKEITLATAYNGQNGVVRFERQGKTVYMLEPEIQDRLKFLRSKRKVANRVVAMIINGRDIHPESLGPYESLKKTIHIELEKMPAAFLVTDRPFHDDEKKFLAPHFEDIFVNPIDRGYFLQKLVFTIPGLRIAEDPVLVTEKRINEVVKAANPVKIDEICEAQMTMTYPRDLTFASYREFILWQPYNFGQPQIVGTCYACEEKEGKEKSYKIYFVLFGMRDQMLKSIRLWIRENYVATKEKASG